MIPIQYICLASSPSDSIPPSGLHLMAGVTPFLDDRALYEGQEETQEETAAA